MLPSSSKTLNPRAPEYYPIPPGINGYPHALLPLFFSSSSSSSSLPPPCSASSQQLYLPPASIATVPPVFLSAGVFSYLPSQQPAFHNMYANYYVAPPIPNGANPLRLPPGAVAEAPPILSVVTSANQSATTFAANVQSGEDVVNPRMARGRQPSGQPRTRGFCGFPAGRGRGCFGRNNNSCNRVEPRRHENNSSNNVNGRYLPKEDNRHKVLPLKQDEENTTVMVKNIPYDCPRKDLIRFLDRFCAKYSNESTSRLGHEEHDIAYDFLYLPIDFKTNKGRGFAFINFTNAGAVWKFFNAFHLKEWDFVKWNKWPKKMEISRAKIQGKEALISHFSNSRFECGTDEFLPVCFNPPRDGSGQPVQMTAVGERRSNISHWEPCSNHKV